MTGGGAEPLGMGPSTGWFASQSLELFPTREATHVLALALLLPAARWALEKCVFMPVSRFLLVPSNTPKARTRGGRLPDKLHRRVVKLSESLWKLLCYSTLTTVGVLATYDQPWLWDTRLCWQAWPHQRMTAPMRWLYALETAYYLATTVMLAVWEVPRRDFAVMMAHHCATFVSIVFTYKYNYTRIGVVVMLLHDVNDVLMEAAKCLNYLRLEAASTAVFSAFVVSWAALRIYAFPRHCIYSAFWESWSLLGYRPPCHGLLNALLACLYGIHLYWFSLILRIVWRKLVTGKVRDIRENGEGNGSSDEDE